MRHSGFFGPALLLVAAACSNGTSLLLEVDVSAAPAEQLHVVGYSQTVLRFGPAVRPERAAERLVGTQSLRILLPDDLPPEPLRVQVTSLDNGQATGSAEALVVPEQGNELPVRMTIAPALSRCPGCAGCCDATDQCRAPTRNACGSAGLACVACSEKLADGCATGGCTCGTTAACDAAVADACSSGTCRCGAGPACALPERCVDGTCR